MLYDKDRQALESRVGEFAGVFINADGSLFVETYNQLNAYFATVPGNYAFNLRKLYLLNTNYADLFLFTILPGETTNAYLGTEYLAVLETDNDTPYYLNLHCGEVGHTLILGMTGSGKTFLSVFLVQNAQKYTPQTYIFDIGGSYESVTRIFGGTYLNVGRESRDFTINPFSLPQTSENMQFLFSFFRVLIEGRDQRYRMDFREEQKLWRAVERTYMLEPTQRTVSNLAGIIGEMKDRLHRWTCAGQYGFLFDNREDTLSFAQFQTFNFRGWGDAPGVLEPLLFYVLHRAGNEIADPDKLATFKMFLLDEAWLFFRNETIRNYVVQAQKTWRKHRAAMILATQSLKELQESGLLPVVAECCPTKIFLANPEMDRAVYAEAFHLNDTELDLIAGLVPPGQMLIRNAQSSKKVRLNVDPVSTGLHEQRAGQPEEMEIFFRVRFRRRVASSGRGIATKFAFIQHHPSPLERSCRMKRMLISITMLAMAVSPIPMIAQDMSARKVQYHSQDIVPIRAKLKYTTLIELPSTEKIMEAATGDKDFWVVDIVGNFCFVDTAKAGISSNLNLITDKGNIYSFTLQDVSERNEAPDLKAIVTPVHRSSVVASSGPPQFVPAAQLEQSRSRSCRSRVAYYADGGRVQERLSNAIEVRLHVQG